MNGKFIVNCCGLMVEVNVEKYREYMKLCQKYNIKAEWSYKTS